MDEGLNLEKEFLPHCDRSAKNYNDENSNSMWQGENETLHKRELTNSSVCYGPPNDFAIPKNLCLNQEIGVLLVFHNK